MAVYAYVLIRVQRGEARETLHLVQQMPEVGLAAAVTGYDDLVITLKVDTAEHLGDVVVSRIQKLPAVIETRTLVVVGDLQPVNWLQFRPPE